MSLWQEKCTFTDFTEFGGLYPLYLQILSLAIAQLLSWPRRSLSTDSREANYPLEIEMSLFRVSVRTEAASTSSHSGTEVYIANSAWDRSGVSRITRIRQVE